MKKIITFFLLFFLFFTTSFALSNSFEFMINTIGIPKYNALGESINEIIYQGYNLFVYSTPETISASIQRFKEVPTLGKYIKNGQRGEYLYLGKDYSGNLISNVYFPVDTVPETYPNTWNYLVDASAYATWNDKTKYKYIEQLEYMKKTDMLFDEIDLVAKKTNPYHLVAYGISANKIGFNKAKLESTSTWRTSGVITTKRLSEKGTVRFAIFSTRPIAEMVKIQSNITAPNEIIIQGRQDSTSACITFGSELLNLNEYTKKEHVKEISSQLYINDELVAEIKDTKQIKVSKEIVLPFSRKENVASVTPIRITVKSYAYTEFSVDGLLIHEISKVIFLKTEEKQEVILPAKLATLERENKMYYIREMIKTSVTDEFSSQGLIETGREVALKLTLLPGLKIKIADKEILYDILYQSEEYDVIKFLLPKQLQPSISSWNYVRDKKENYFQIHNSDIGKRLKQPYYLELEYSQEKQIIYFDTIDYFYFTMNYYFPNCLNKEKVIERQGVERWN